MAFPPLSRSTHSRRENQSGIALAMVAGAIAVLAILVTEFSYVAQVNQKNAYDGLDLIQAQYTARAGLKISLLRLKAFVAARRYLEQMNKQTNGMASKLIPPSALDQIWSFPLPYPIPADIPGITEGDKDKIRKFTQESGLAGKFSSVIESEASRFNLNLILAGFAPQASASPSPSPSASPSGQGDSSTAPDSANPTSTSPGGGASPSASPEFDPDATREQLANYLNGILQTKMENDERFADSYRDPNLINDIVAQISAWADRKFTGRTTQDSYPYKRGPFYHVSELRLLPAMDDDLYGLFAPQLTANKTPGIDVNSITEPALRALFPGVLPEEMKRFFEVRDSTEQNGKFAKVEDFFAYIEKNFSAYSKTALDQRRETLLKAGVTFSTELKSFKITVKAQVNQTSRLIEAWVSLTEAGATNPAQRSPLNGANPVTPPPGAVPQADPLGRPPQADPGLRITFMRVL